MTTTITISDAKSTTTLISTTPNIRDDESSIVTASAVVGFILVSSTFTVLFLPARLADYGDCSLA